MTYLKGALSPSRTIMATLHYWGIFPSCFGRDEDNGRSILIKQPEGEEVALCEEAMESCPVGAIGDDGEFKNFRNGFFNNVKKINFYYF